MQANLHLVHLYCTYLHAYAIIVGNMKEALTPNQQRIYSKICTDLQEKQEAPTLEELMNFMGANSINSMVQYLEALEKKGYIIRRKNAKRNIELRDKDRYNNTSTISVPVIASVGCDDLSVFANENYDESIEVDKTLIGENKKIMAVRAVGNSMNDADIHDGDYVLVEMTSKVKSGDRVVAVVGDMVTVKKLEIRDNMLILRPESKDPRYKPIILGSDFNITGKVMAVIPGDSMDITEVVYSYNQ